MAKKKKKQTKLNQAIRHFFGDDGFDDGIERVPSETLRELIQYMGILPDQNDKPFLVRLLRRLWSEADVHIREGIVDFFKLHGEVYFSDKPKEAEQDRVQLIESLLSDISDLTPLESRQLFDIFIQVRSKKINAQKMLSKLSHLRFETHRQELEKVLHGRFDSSECFIFNAPIEYKVYDTTFTKIESLKTKQFEYGYFENKSDEEVILEITQLKTTLTASRQEAITNFFKALPQKHPYLKADEIIYALKTAPQSDALISTNFSNTQLLHILQKHFKISDAIANEEDLILGMEGTYTLPFSEDTINYEMHVHFNKSHFLHQLLMGSPLDVMSAFEVEQQHYGENFEHELSLLLAECRRHASLLNWDDKELHERVYELLLPHLHRSLSIPSKVRRKVLFNFNQSIQHIVQKRQRQALLAQTIRDFKNLFPLARELRRKLILHIGPTNSGKTYTAMQALKKADTGYYLAPLRLLALEGYEGIKAEGIDASLITGEEQIVHEEATHISSTIEMLSFEVDVDVCVIDEVQMIDDRDRGWAWANAIIGAPAKTVIMTGSPNSKDAIIALAEYLGEPLEIVEFERKNPLELMHSATNINDIEPNTAVIAFSRKDVLRIKQQLSKQYKVSVVYGNLSPEVRREEARRFREGETEVLVATDAIAMGLNMPIKTILFFKSEKFDGENNRVLTPSEIHQIAGRAGRFGMHEKGYVGALRPDVLKVVHKQFPRPAKTIKIPFNVMANLEHIKLVGAILEETSLSEIMKFFVENMKFDGPFKAASLEGMLEASQIIDHYDIDLPTKYHLACAPLSIRSPYIVAAYERYTRALQAMKPVAYIPPAHLGRFAPTMEELLEAEDRVKEISLYLWLSYRFGDYFVDVEKAKQYRVILNTYIENTLKESNFIPRCRQCAKPLALNAEHAICQSCFVKLNREKRRTDHGGKRKETQDRKSNKNERKRARRGE